MIMMGFVFSLDAAQAAALRASKPMIPPLCRERKEPQMKNVKSQLALAGPLLFQLGYGNLFVSCSFCSMTMPHDIVAEL